MAIDLSGAKQITIPEGDVKGISVNGSVIWSKSGSGGDEPPVLLSWDHVLWSIANNRYTSDYSVGDLIPLDLGAEGNINMQIVAFDADNKADGTGESHITFVSKELLETTHRMNPALEPSSAPYNEGTGTIGGWEKSEMRSYLKSTIKPLIRSDVRSAIVNVTKYTSIYNAAGTKVADAETTDDVWIPSAREIVGGTTQETKGVYYSGVFNSAETRKKMKVNTSSAEVWWLRSAHSTTKFRRMSKNGTDYYTDADTSYGVALGFCM